MLHECVTPTQITNIVIIAPLISGLNTALVGLSLTYIISLAGMLQYVVRQSAEVESIVSLTFCSYPRLGYRRPVHVCILNCFPYERDIDSYVHISKQPYACMLAITVIAQIEKNIYECLINYYSDLIKV